MGGDGRKVDRFLVHHLGDDVVGAPVHRQEAKGGEVAGIGRHDAVLMPMNSITAGDCAGPEPPKDRSANRAGSMPRWMVICRMALAWSQLAISMMPWASCSALSIAGQPSCKRFQAAACAQNIELDAAADQRRRQPAEDEIGVGDGRLLAAVRIAHRAGHGAGAARPDVQLPFARNPGDRAAAGADRLDVEHRNAHREAADAAAVGDLRLGAFDQAEVGRGAAGVERHQVGKSGDLGDTALPSAPAAGPESAVVIGLRMTWSGLATPPLDCITRNGFSFQRLRRARRGCGRDSGSYAA